MISDMLSKHVGAVKSVLKKWFKINDIQLVHLLVVWYLVIYITFINQLMYSIITVIDVKILLYKSLKDTN